ncbi:MAG: M23 family metallopeptidase [Muribaculaceae bacterium]|nr:M23 family metallopeptidase [Muribaculaceae bacterium]MDE6542073.1 M23 family metallopeptidase [Muribaculaceae bacterium]
MKLFKGHKSELRRGRMRRLDYINEAAFSRVWSVRFSRRQALALGAVAIAAVAALVYMIMAFTPLRRLLPGALPGDMRGRYIEATLRLDSLSRAVRATDAYMANVQAIMEGSVDPDSAKAAQRPLTELTDTLMSASDAERAFVQAFESSQRYNLSVLAPIAAEAMAFYSPAPGAESTPAADGKSVSLQGARSQGVDAVYRGSVVSATADSRGLWTIVIQHPNEFISVYSGLAECFTARGAAAATGSRIGLAPADGAPVTFELWHKGNALNPADYVAF